ncbi:MAG TPA: phytanoyl-CoA dioxygenase family protein [Planctomycetaceae bacterium]|nr:phytanoyl-CoA dioxygenase family protein [Planctomycetaceae bacterium]
MSNPSPLSAQQLDEFRQNGFVVLRSFYDVKTEIEPIQRAIHRIIGIVIRKYGLNIEQAPFSPSAFDSGYAQLIAHNRRYGAEIYDAVKQIPAFIRLTASPQHDAVLSQIRASDLPGVAAGGYGIRIDNPHEEKFRAPWHQDYLAQFRSIDGLVFWSPLVSMTADIGPVEFCVGSQVEGPIRVHTRDPDNPDKSGAYALRLENETELINRYPRVSPLCEPGDAVLLDFLVVHRSGENRAQRSRWSMQMRYFNFQDPTGIQLGWHGAFAAGVRLEQAHPELVVS